MEVARAEVTATRDEVAGQQARSRPSWPSPRARAEAVNRRLYGGEVSASRELQAMAADVESLKARASALEDQVLELMEEREPLEARLAELAGETRRPRRPTPATRPPVWHSGGGRGRRAGRPGASAGRAGRAGASRPAGHLRPAPGPAGGVAVARLVGNHCDGCHLTLPAMELDRIRHLPAPS